MSRTVSSIGVVDVKALNQLLPQGKIITSAAGNRQPSAPILPQLQRAALLLMTDGMGHRQIPFSPLWDSSDRPIKALELLWLFANVAIGLLQSSTSTLSQVYFCSLFQVLTLRALPNTLP